MKRSFRAAMIFALAASVALPALSDQGRGHGRDKHHRKEHRQEYSERHRDYRGCPPGLAKKHNGCRPPGHARKHYGRGDVLYGDYDRVRDYDRYDLERRRGWDYYRDDDRIYRVDSNTRKILAVINLIDAFSN